MRLPVVPALSYKVVALPPAFLAELGFLGRSSLALFCFENTMINLVKDLVVVGSLGETAKTIFTPQRVASFLFESEYFLVLFFFSSHWSCSISWWRRRRRARTAAPSAHSGAVAVFYRAVEHFSVEALQTYGANVVSFQLASGDRRWFIVGCYFAPDGASTIEDVVAAISKRPRGGALLVVSNFNTDLVVPEGRERDEGVAAALAEEGLEDMSGHFLPWHKPWFNDDRTWAMHWSGR